MKTYKFAVSLCGGWCNGHIEISAKNDEVAYEKAMDYVANKLVKAFPTLDINYDVECDNPDECHTFTAFIYEDDGITTTDLSTYDSKEEAVEFAKCRNWDEVINDNTGEVVWKR